MDVYLVFNELCLALSRAAIEHKSTAQNWMVKFGEVITQARLHGVKVLRVADGFFELSLMPDYTIRDWTIDQSVDRELKRRIQSAATSDELLPDTKEAKERGLAFEFMYEEEPADGLGYAHLLDSIAVSLETEEVWKQIKIQVNVNEIIELNGDLQVVPSEEPVPVNHACNKDHIDQHKAWLQAERFLTSVEDGPYLLSKTDDWFPNLIIIDNAKSQIRRLSRGTPQLRQIVIKLFELENHCKQWFSGPFDKDKLASKATPESISVAGNAHYVRMRTFKLPDGREEYFEWHLRLTPDEWRLFFLPDPVVRKIYVGYAGRKLPTKKYPTV